MQEEVKQLDTHIKRQLAELEDTKKEKELGDNTIQRLKSKLSRAASALAEEDEHPSARKHPMKATHARLTRTASSLTIESSALEAVYRKDLETE